MLNIPASKLTPPAAPRELVERPALRAALDRGDARALTLVCAPPGFGKSLLLADWVRHSSDIPTAWVSLDQDDNDPRRVWSAVLAALRGCPGVPPSSRLRHLVVSRTTVEPEFLADLLDSLDALPTRVRLVLDDVHHLRSGSALRGLQMLVRGRGPGVRLVLASRLDPGLPLARLRLEDRLCDVRAEQLRFSEPESAALLERCGLRLDSHQVALLHERTGGWVAGLRLAAMSMRGHPEPDRFLATFSGDERPVADYLIGEVLAGISDDQREVLRCTSIVDPVPAALAVELCHREDAPDLLGALARDLGLVTGTGTHRSDYHTQELLRSYLIADLNRQGAGLASALHERAARWWDGQGRPIEALRHGARAGDGAVLTELLHRWAPELSARGEHPALLAALRVAGEQPREDSWFAAVSAQVHLGRGARAAAAADVRRARGMGPVPAESTLSAFLTATERLAGVGDCPPDAEPVPDDAVLAALMLAGRGAGRIRAGAVAEGRVDLEVALDRARILRLSLLEVQCHCLLAAAAWAVGDHRAAASAAAGATATAHAGGWDDSAWASGAHAVAALAALGRARPEDARRAAAEGLRTAPDELDPVIRYALRTARAGALCDSGDGTTGLWELQQARAEIGEVSIPAALVTAAALLEHRIALRLQHATAADAAVSWLASRGVGRPERLLMRAWTESAAGATSAARSTIAPLLDSTTSSASPITEIEAWLLEAKAALDQGGRLAARYALRSALDRAERLDALRPFTFAGPGLRAMLVDMAGGMDSRSGFAVRVLAARRRDGHPPTCVLTARECDVLCRLPSLANLEQIADDLSVSVNTIKSHVRAIYDKLGTNSRRSAILLAHERGLLV